MQTKNKNLEKYFAEIVLLPDQTFKFVLAKKLTKINQFKNRWLRMDARDLARKVNAGNIVIN